jgi:hypothetical protein
MNTEDQIRKRIQDIEWEIAPLADKKAELTRQLHELIAEFKPGEIITWAEGTKKGHVLYAFPEFGFGSIMSYRVRTIRKNGCLGREQTVHDWQNPKKFTP